MNVVANRLVTGLAATALALFLNAVPAMAGDEDPVATVNGMTITAGELAMAESDLDPQFEKLPAEQRRAAALSALIEIKLLAKRAEDAGVADDAAFKQRMAFLRERALHSAVVEKEVAAGVTDEAVRARYDKEVADTPPQSEVHARHILLKTKEEAEAVIKELDGGADFVELAKSKSTGPSGPQGGDLGYFRQGQMVPEFEKAAFAMEPGSYSKEPVQTQFGWHVLKVEDKRPIQPPSFDEVKDRLRSAMLRDAYFALVGKIREEATVDVKDEALKKALADLEQAK